MLCCFTAVKAKYTFDFSEEEEEEDGDEEPENDASASPVHNYKDTERHNDDKDDDDDIFPSKTTFTTLYVLSLYSLLGESLKALRYKHFRFIFQKLYFLYKCCCFRTIKIFELFS